MPFDYAHDSRSSESPEINLITAIIQDAKDNLVDYGRRKRLTGLQKVYLDESFRFLRNENGMLAYYLEKIPRVDIEECLDKLRNYADRGWKHERIGKRRETYQHATHSSPRTRRRMA